MTGAFTPHHTDHTENGADDAIEEDDPETSDLLSTADTLAILGISVQTLKRRRHAGLITPVPVNPAKHWAQRYYRRVDVERLRRGG
ncbi:MAG TPA: helix-turn-helix domain-containing protein [Ktedonobacterales bacterium]